MEMSLGSLFHTHKYMHTRSYIGSRLGMTTEYTHCQRKCSLTLTEHEYVSFKIKGPFTLNMNACVCIFENNRCNGTKTQMQRMGYVPILYVDVNVAKDTMLKFDVNADTNVNVDAHCERA